MQNETEVLYRRIATEDIDAFVSLAHDMHAASKYAHVPFVVDDIKDLVHYSVLDVLHTWVVEVNNTVVGALIISTTGCVFNKKYKIANDIALYIREEHRNIRNVTALVKLADTWCRENNIHAFVLGITAPEDEKQAERIGLLYARMGFAPWGAVFRKEY